MELKVNTPQMDAYQVSACIAYIYIYILVFGMFMIIYLLVKRFYELFTYDSLCVCVVALFVQKQVIVAVKRHVKKKKDPYEKQRHAF